MWRQKTENREIRGGEDNGDMTSRNSTGKPACFTQLNRHGECQEAKHRVSCHNSPVIIYTTSAVPPLRRPPPSPFEVAVPRRRDVHVISDYL